MRFAMSVAVLCAAALLAGCATVRNTDYATPEEAAAAAYIHDGPPAITLYTMINNRTQAGAHTSIMINASQRVIFDPAGSVQLTAVPEIDDVLYGITPRVADWYERAHARETYHVRIQRKEVPAQVAEQALRLVQQNGAVTGSLCTKATADILRQLPGFENISSVWFPGKLAEQFATLPGVTERRLFEDDPDDKGLAEAAFEAELARGRADQPAQ